MLAWVILSLFVIGLALGLAVPPFAFGVQWRPVRWPGVGAGEWIWRLLLSASGLAIAALNGAAVTAMMDVIRQPAPVIPTVLVIVAAAAPMISGWLLAAAWQMDRFLRERTAERARLLNQLSTLTEAFQVSAIPSSLEADHTSLVNPAFTRLFGSPDVPPELDALLDQMDELSAEVDLPTAQGQRTLLLNAARLPDGQGVSGPDAARLITAVDVTTLHQARAALEARLRASEETLAQARNDGVAHSRQVQEQAGQLNSMSAERGELVHKLNGLQQAQLDGRRALNAAAYRGRLERLVTALAVHYIHPAAQVSDADLERALAVLGRQAGADRCYLYLFCQADAATAISSPAIDPAENIPLSSDLPETGGLGEPCGSEDRLIEWTSEGAPPHRFPGGRLSLESLLYWAPREVTSRLERLETVFIPRLPAAEGAPAGGSLAVTPLVWRRQALGYLGFQTMNRPLEWGQDMIGLLKITAEMFVNVLQAGQQTVENNTALDLALRQLAQAEQHSRESKRLGRLSDLLQFCRTPDEAYPIIARSVQDLLPGVSGALYMIRKGDGMGDAVVHWGEAAPQEGELALNECWGLRRGKPHHSNALDSTPMCTHLVPATVGALCIPLSARGETIGLLQLREDLGASAHLQAPVGGMEAASASVDPVRARISIQEAEPLAVQIGEMIALALANLNQRDHLRSQAIRDPLTGLFNRRYMEETLDRELRRGVRHNTSVAVIMFDVDRLKPINDTYGHDAGDEMLRSLGRLVMESFRGEDVACRYGGDEFTIILPEASLSDAWQRAEGLREAVRKMDVRLDGKRLGPVTLSIGAGVFPDHGRDAERLLQAADEAAYRSKAEGGDRVMIARGRDET
jgi:diguanylate cyclase (GGDEF)-like protein